MKGSYKAVTKICVKKDKCINLGGPEQSLASFHKNKANKDGLAGICKSCKKALSREFREAHASEILEYKKQYYINNPDKAAERKEKIKEYNASPERKLARAEYKKQYWEDNKGEINTLRNKRYASDPELRKEKTEKTRRYRANNKNEVHECKKQYRIEHKSEISERQRQRYAVNSEDIKERNGRWRANNPGKMNAYGAKRRASKKERTPGWADEWKIEQYYIVARKLTDTHGIDFHVDHKIPLQGENVSGLHVHNNLEIITATENHVKNNRFEPIFGI